MKKSSLLLVILLGCFLITLIGTTFILKNQYNHIDKSDPFWNYTKLKKGSFHHLIITGGNVTRITFIPSPHASIGVLSSWEDQMGDRIKTRIAKDTLFVQVEALKESHGMQEWIRGHVLITITCPELQSVQAFNTNLDVRKLRQNYIKVQLSGRSILDIESYQSNFDSVSVYQRDTSTVVFEMADEIKSSGVMQLHSLNADVQGRSLLDVGHFRIQSLHKIVGDTAGIILSGYTLSRVK